MATGVFAAASNEGPITVVTFRLPHPELDVLAHAGDLYFVVLYAEEVGRASPPAVPLT